MKNFIRFFLIMVWAALILGGGYYLLIHNLCLFWAGEKPELLFDWNSSGIRIRTGRWVEVIKFDRSVTISRNQRRFTVKSDWGILTVFVNPEFKIRWQKKL